jgi:hypothetical protein
MRSAKGIASRALVVILAALFAGCSSSSPGSQSLPSGSAQSAASRPGVGPQFVPKGHMTPLRLLELQAAGKLAGPVPRKVLERQLRAGRSQAHPFLNRHSSSSSSIGLWTTATEFGYLLGQTTSGATTVAAVNTELSGCYVPITVKVDASKNVWVSCELNADNEDEFTGGAMQEYSSNGTLKNRYAYSVCVTDYVYCFGYGFDGATD